MPLIKVFEYDILKPDWCKDFTEDHLIAFEKYYGDKGCPYFSLVNKGIRFCNYVGVIRVGNLTIEVLPKIDRQNNGNEDVWHHILIDMLKIVGLLKVRNTSQTELKLKSNSILDLYIELFIQECEQLLHQGLVKRYRSTEGNLFALKGRLMFGKHISRNIVHQERFYVSYTTYDKEHKLNQILYKTLHMLGHINSRASLTGRINKLLLDFPELPDLKVNEETFDKISYHRKTEGYKTAIEIARLLLLKYHPDIRSGRNNVLALMFDMNQLWELYILKMLKRTAIGSNITIQGQERKVFWQPDKGWRRNMKPDILLSYTKEGKPQKIIIDTKWKVPYDMRPSDDDLRQIFAYTEYFEAEEGILLYPSVDGSIEKHKGDFKVGSAKGSVWRVNVLADGKLNKEIGKDLICELLSLV